MNADSLIEKLQSLEVTDTGEPMRFAHNAALEKAIAIVRSYQAEQPQDVVQRVATAIRNRVGSSLDASWQYYLPEAQAAIAAMEDAFTRKDEAADALLSCPANSSGYSVNGGARSSDQATVTPANHACSEMRDDRPWATRLDALSHALLKAMDANHLFAINEEVGKNSTALILAEVALRHFECQRAPGPVSVDLEKCRKAFCDVAYHRLGKLDNLDGGIKAILEAAGVKYVD